MDVTGVHQARMVDSGIVLLIGMIFHCLIVDIIEDLIFVSQPHTLMSLVIYICAIIKLLPSLNLPYFEPEILKLYACLPSLSVVGDKMWYY